MLIGRLAKEKVMSGVMFFITCASLLLVVAMGVGLCLRSSPILSEISLWDILSANEWKPAKNQFGFFPFIMGTVCVTGISIELALPVSLFTALILTEYSFLSGPDSPLAADCVRKINSSKDLAQ